MQRVQYCPALPGCCYLCGSSNREWFVDTDRSIEFHGAVYFCNKCIEELGTLAGMTSAEDTDALKAKIEHQENVIFDLTVQVSGLEQAVDGLRTAGSITRVNPLHPSLLPADSSGQEALSGEDNLGPQGREIDESGDDQGLGELHPTESRSDDASFTLDL